MVTSCSASQLVNLVPYAFKENGITGLIDDWMTGCYWSMNNELLSFGQVGGQLCDYVASLAVLSTQ